MRASSQDVRHLARKMAGEMALFLARTREVENSRDCNLPVTGAGEPNDVFTRHPRDNRLSQLNQKYEEP